MLPADFEDFAPRANPRTIFAKFWRGKGTESHLLPAKFAMSKFGDLWPKVQQTYATYLRCTAYPMHNFREICRMLVDIRS